MGGSNSDMGYSITVDSSDNVYITGYTDESVSPQISMNTIIAKYNSSGDIQWQRLLGSSTNTDEYGFEYNLITRAIFMLLCSRAQ